MSEAVLRIQRQASDFSKSVQGLRKDVAELAQQLEPVDSRLAQGVRSIEIYREQLRKGSQSLNLENYERVQQVVRQRMTQLRGTPGAEEALSGLDRYTAPIPRGYREVVPGEKPGRPVFTERFSGRRMVQTDDEPVVVQKAAPQPGFTIPPAPPRDVAAQPGTVDGGTPSMITHNMKRQLRDLGWTDADIGLMTPSDAWTKIQGQQRASAQAPPIQAPPRATRPPESAGPGPSPAASPTSPASPKMSPTEIDQKISETEKAIEKAAAQLNLGPAAVQQLKDKDTVLQDLLGKRRAAGAGASGPPPVAEGEDFYSVFSSAFNVKPAEAAATGPQAARPDFVGHPDRPPEAAGPGPTAAGVVGAGGATPPPGGGSGPPRRPPGDGGGPPEDEDPREKARKETQASEEQISATEKARRAFEALRREKRALSDVDLVKDWRENARALRNLDSELGSVSRRLQDFRDREELGIPFSKEHVEGRKLAFHRRRRIEDSIRDAEQSRAAIEEEIAGRRGITMTEDGPRIPQRGFRISPMGAFIGGVGLGGFGLPGAMAGVAVDAFRHGNEETSTMERMKLMGGGMSGLALGAIAWDAVRSYQAQVGALRHTVPMAQMTGRPSAYFKRMAIDAASRYPGAFNTEDLFRAQRGLLEGAGSADLGRTSILPVATLTGQTASSETQRFVRFSELAARFSPGASADVLRAYRMSSMARPERGNAFYGAFAEEAAKLAGQTISPFTATSPEGVAFQLAETTKLKIPGIPDMGSKGGLRIASSVLSGMYDMASGKSGGALGDLQLMGVAKLRSSLSDDQRKQLEKLGINIDTIAGMREAVERAPELAAQGLPQVAQSIFRTQREYMPEPVRTLALQNRYGATGGRLLSQMPEADYMTIMEASGRAKLGEKPDKDLMAEARELMQREPGARALFGEDIEPGLQDLRRDSVLQLGAEIRLQMNDIRDAVHNGMEGIKQFIESWFNQPGPDLPNVPEHFREKAPTGWATMMPPGSINR